MKAMYVDHHAADDVGNAAHRRVGAVMSHPVRCIPASTPLADALNAMAITGLRHLMVLDDCGAFLGILSDRTIAAAWAVDPNCLTWTQAVMVLDPGRAVVPPSANVLAAARAMRTAETDAVAVVDDAGAVVGILTGSDMIAQLAR